MAASSEDWARVAMFAQPARNSVDSPAAQARREIRSEEHTSELQSHVNLVCRLLLEKKKSRDSLHEHELRTVARPTHQYPAKRLAEVLSTSPQYWRHCTRMDLVGNSTPADRKLKHAL